MDFDKFAHEMSQSARQDQIDAALATMAHTLWTYYASLLMQGFSTAVALEIVRDYQEILLLRPSAN